MPAFKTSISSSSKIPFLLLLWALRYTEAFTSGVNSVTRRSWFSLTNLLRASSSDRSPEKSIRPSSNYHRKINVQLKTKLGLQTTPPQNAHVEKLCPAQWLRHTSCSVLFSTDTSSFISCTNGAIERKTHGTSFSPCIVVWVDFSIFPSPILTIQRQIQLESRSDS